MMMLFSPASVFFIWISCLNRIRSNPERIGSVFLISKGSAQNGPIEVPVGVPVKPGFVSEVLRGNAVPRVVEVKTRLRSDDMREIKDLEKKLSSNAAESAISVNYFPLVYDLQSLIDEIRANEGQGAESYEKLEAPSIHALVQNERSVLIYWTKDRLRDKRSLHTLKAFQGDGDSSSIYLGEKNAILYRYEPNTEPFASPLQVVMATWESEENDAKLSLELHSTQDSDGDNIYILNMQFKIIQANSWYLKEADLEIPQTPKIPVIYVAGGGVSNMKSRPNFCFSCAKSQFRSVHNSSKSSVDYRLVFEKLKVQPFRFDESFSSFVNDCTGFFSPAIWSGIVVVFTILAAFVWAIWMMMSISSVQKFDDPRQKSLPIAEERM